MNYSLVLINSLEFDSNYYLQEIYCYYYYYYYSNNFLSLNYSLKNLNYPCRNFDCYFLKIRKDFGLKVASFRHSS